MAETVLETHGLTMRFGGVTASDNVNFKLKARELRCLIGPNGAGKSTFFKCVTGLLTPSEGQVFMRGQDVTGWQPHQITALGVGIKTQTPNVMDAFSVHENIWLSARRFHSTVEARERAEAIIDRLALGCISTMSARERVWPLDIVSQNFVSRSYESQQQNCLLPA